MEHTVPRHIHIKDGRKEYFIAPNDILFVKADGNYCDIYLTLSTRYDAVRIQIGKFWKLIEQLDTPHFLARIDRSTIINIKYVKFVDTHNGILTLRRNNEEVKVTIAKSSGAILSERLAPLMKLNEEAITIKREDFPDEQTYNLMKSADDLKRMLNRMNTLYNLFKE